MKKEKLLLTIENTWIFFIKLIQGINAFIFYFYCASAIFLIGIYILFSISKDTEILSFDSNSQTVILLVCTGLGLLFASYRAYVSFFGKFYTMKFLGGLILTSISIISVYIYGWYALIFLPIFGGLGMIVGLFLLIASLFVGGTSLYNEEGEEIGFLY